MLTETENHEKALYYIINNIKLVITYIETLTMALPINVAPKNTENGTRKWLHKNPAKSKRGFGTYKYY